jgi:hypothetical protein
MRIEIKDKGTKEFYKEVVSVMAQYTNLIRKPQMKYRDAFKSYRIMGICMCILIGMQLWLGFIDKFDALRVTAMAVVACAALVVFLYDRIMMKQVRRFLEDDKSSVVTLDEMGVEINKSDSQIVRLAWDNVAFVRAFKESVCFFSKDNSRIVLAVTKDHESEINKYLDDNSIDVIRIERV